MIRVSDYSSNSYGVETLSEYNRSRNGRVSEYVTRIGFEYTVLECSSRIENHLEYK